MVLTESGVRKSFNSVRNDILEIKNQILRFAEEQQELRDMVLKNRQKLVKTKKSEHANKVSDTVKTVKSKTKSYVAAKEGSKFHITECPYAKNIKPKSKLVFKSKEAALNKNYKPCSCVLK